mgnify:CR=1 FL=1
MSFVAELEPVALWYHFDEILKIPRGSGQEERIREHVISVARKNGLKHKVDAAGNVVDVRSVAKDVAHGVIEEFMLAANEAVAGWLHERGLPALYRVHAGPAEEAQRAPPRRHQPRVREPLRRVEVEDGDARAEAAPRHGQGEEEESPPQRRVSEVVGMARPGPQSRGDEPPRVGRILLEG